MFTGIVEAVGRIESLAGGAEGARLRVDARALASAGTGAAPLALGNSIAVNGCCLTVAALDCDVFVADLSPETLRLTAFHAIKPGAPVNLERPLNPGKELGGHFVQGHVDGTGRVIALAPQGDGWRLAVRVPAGLERYIASKGSIAIDGISLTVAAINGGMVEAAIIPFTYAHTNLQGIRAGDEVNVETDILAKYAEKLMEARRAPAAAASRLTVERLIEEGF